MLQDQLNLAALARLQDHNSHFAESVYQQMKHSWFPTLLLLQALNLRPTDPAYQIVEGWIRIGHAAGLSESAEREQYFWRLHNRVIPAHTPTCHWKTCLCSTVKPKHGLKACTGCWSVFYCGVECQTNDWLAHRRDCQKGKPKKHQSLNR
ncbi:hypothetical protein K474DRAFT_1498461 [Panus rudis PR-1116 ss-1]|nr:hypothetical protein K474DRAFT_1498461 [Panus rudis PR-1116 ss-1]